MSTSFFGAWWVLEKEGLQLYGSLTFRAYEGGLVVACKLYNLVAIVNYEDLPN